MKLDSGHACPAKRDQKVVHIEGGKDIRRRHRIDAIDVHQEKSNTEDTPLWDTFFLRCGAVEATTHTDAETTIS